MQEVTWDLQRTAKIILEQNPNALKWASARYWEFGEILAHKHQLEPNRSTNGLDGNAFNDKRTLFFDQHYGDGSGDPYYWPDVSLRLSLQLMEGERPACMFKASLDFNFMENRGEENETSKCYGHIRLTGRYGTSWKIDARLRCDDEEQYKELCERFCDVFKPEYFTEERFEGEVIREKYCDVLLTGKTNSAEARDLFRDMVEYFIAKHEPIKLT